MLLVLWIYLDLIEPRESIHERHPLESACVVNHDIGNRKREFVLGACRIQIAKVDANAGLPVFLRDRNNISNPIGVLLLSNEARIN